MRYDLSKISDDDLRALNRGDLSSVSDDGLRNLRNQELNPPGAGFTGGLEAAGLGALKGAQKFGLGVQSASAKLADLIPGVDRLLKATTGMPTFASGVPLDAPERMFSPYQHPSIARHPIAEQIGEFAGGAAPLAAMPELGFAEKLGAGGSLASRLLGRGAELSAEGAAINPIYDPRETLGRAAAKGALTNLAVGGALTAPYLQGLRRMIGGTGRAGEITPEEFKSNLEAQQGIQMPIGDVAQSPAMKSLYTKVSSVLGSGADKPYVQLSKKLAAQHQDVLGDVPGNIANPNEYVYQDKLNNYLASKESTNQAYNNLAQHADRNNVPFDRTSLDNAVNSLSDEFSQKSTTATATKLYKPMTDILDDYKSSSIPTFKDAVNQMPVINDLLQDASSANNRPLMRTLKTLKDGMESSIENSSKQNPELNDLYGSAKAARRNQGTYEMLNKRQKTPFYNAYLKDDPTARTNLINQYIKPSKGTADNSSLLEALTSKITPEARQVLAHSYLDEDSIGKMAGKLKGLNSAQRNLLLGDKAQLSEDFLKTARQSPRALSAGFQPLTGFTGSQAAQLGGAIGAGATHAILGHPLLALGTAGALPAIGQLSQRVLRSQGLKNAYLRSLEGKEIKGNTLTQALRRRLIPTVSPNQGLPNG